MQAVRRLLLPDWLRCFLFFILLSLRRWLCWVFVLSCVLILLKLIRQQAIDHLAEIFAALLFVLSCVLILLKLVRQQGIDHLAEIFAVLRSLLGTERDRLVGTVVHHLAVDQRDDAVGIERKLAVVGDQHQRLLMLAAQRHHQLHDLAGGLGVQVAGRLVGKDDLRLCHKGAGDADALLLTAGHLGGLVVHALAQSHLFEDHLGAAVAQSFADAAEHQRHGDVFQRAV